MKKEVVLILAEDDEGHARLIIKNLRKAGFGNRVILFEDGDDTLDFLFRRGSGPHRDDETSYLLLLDISMPMVSGIEVLQQIKQDNELQNMPVVMITTTCDPKEIEQCYKLGCRKYITKNTDYEKFSEEIKGIGSFLCD